MRQLTFPLPYMLASGASFWTVVGLAIAGEWAAAAVWVAGTAMLVALTAVVCALDERLASTAR